MTCFIGLIKTLLSIGGGDFCQNRSGHKVFSQKALCYIFDMFFDTPKGFIVAHRGFTAIIILSSEIIIFFKTFYYELFYRLNQKLIKY